MYFRKRSQFIFQLKRTVKMIDFLYKRKVRKSTQIRTFILRTVCL